MPHGWIPRHEFEMAYVVLCDDSGVEPRSVRVARDALVIARDLEDEGRLNVRIRTPDGETLPIRSFEALQK